MGEGQHGSKSEATHMEHTRSSGGFIAQLTRCLWLSVVSSSYPKVTWVRAARFAELHTESYP